MPPHRHPPPAREGRAADALPRTPGSDGDEERVLALFDALPRVDPPASVGRALLARLEPSQTPPGGGRAAGFAAALLLALAAGGIVWAVLAREDGADAPPSPSGPVRVRLVDDPGVPLYPEVESFGVESFAGGRPGAPLGGHPVAAEGSGTAGVHR